MHWIFQPDKYINFTSNSTFIGNFFKNIIGSLIGADYRINDWIKAEGCKIAE
jgi:hypothetical protein